MKNVDLQVLISVLSGAAIVLILLRKWVWKFCRLLGRTALGGAVLAVLAQFSGVLGFSLGVNLVNALVLGVLGIPGFALLWALRLVSGG